MHLGMQCDSWMSEFSWRPGIGDPTLGGWITVALYLATAASCWRLQRKLLRDAPGSPDRCVWWSLAILFLLLGNNKQLDLQSALTEIGRILARLQGWYAQRESVQLAFIVFVLVACLAALLILLWWGRQGPPATWLALVGAGSVFAYVLIRAASFHHIDRFIGERVFGLRFNWIFEMGGITVVLLASWWRRRQIRVID